MVRYIGKFQVLEPKEGSILPRKVMRGENFWCSFNTKKQLIMCSIVYMGEDESMLKGKDYDCIIELPYGEVFPPLGNEYKEPIELNAVYLLQCADRVIGSCVLLSKKEVVYGSYDIRKGPEG